MTYNSIKQKLTEQWLQIADIVATSSTAPYLLKHNVRAYDVVFLEEGSMMNDVDALEALAGKPRF